MINPVHFPTTVIFVDDSSNFLSSVGMMVDEQLSFKTYQNPLVALRAFDYSPVAELSFCGENVFTASKSIDTVNDDVMVFDVNLSHLMQLIHDPLRFEQASVIVVDYSMPDINGVDFCKRLKSPDICKILLTGQAEEKVAIQAFNEGIIDVYIRKQQPNVLRDLQSAISRLQCEYFRRKAVVLLQLMTAGPYQFLEDPAFVDFFERTCAGLNIVEHYIQTSPVGVMLVDAQGKTYMLIVHTMESLRSEWEIAQSLGASATALKRMQQQLEIPLFPPNVHYGPQYSNWSDYLHPGHELIGRKRYMHALVPNPPVFAGANILSYAQYLDS